MSLKFMGFLVRDGRWWVVGVPALEVWSQGKTRIDACRMIKEAVEMSINRPIKVNVLPMPGNCFVLYAKDSRNDRYLLATMLKRQRGNSGLSLGQTAKRLKVASKTYSQYEQGRLLPSITKILEYISAMNNDDHVVLDVVSKQGPLRRSYRFLSPKSY
ncbi:MAG: helix-turn-helix domain-containing protein [bacterium]